MLALLALAARSPAQEATRRDRDRADIMLRTIHDDIRRHYYDTTYAGLDLPAHFDAARRRLEGARTNSELFAILAQALFALEDSHTILWPPSRAVEVKYGWGLNVIGDSCYVIAVEAGSDAARQRVRVGDQVLAVDGYRPARRDFWKLHYVMAALSPRSEVAFRLKSPDGTVRDVRVQSRVRELRRQIDLTGSDGGADFWELYRRWEDDVVRSRDEFVTVGDSTLVWRMPTFVVDNDAIDNGIGRARRHRNMVLDLRGNGGGYTRALSRMVGRILGRETTIGILHRRRDLDTMLAKPHSDPFTGRLVVLVDSRSASASELFARMMQLEHRGTVVGDRTAGAVMQSRGYQHEAGDAAVTAFYYMSVTDADVIMSDGRSLEREGVTPDSLLLPSATDLAQRRDPVLAAALRMLGQNVDAARAGALLGPRRIELDLW